MFKQKMYLNRFIISTETGPVTLVGVLSYQKNVKPKSGIKFTVSVVNRQRIFRHRAKYGTLTICHKKMEERGEVSSKTPLN